MRLPQATANCFIYLETGILPIEHEIYRRQFTFHHLLNLDNDDPVKKLYYQMRELPSQKNWATSLETLKTRYNIQLSDVDMCVIYNSYKNGYNS